MFDDHDIYILRENRFEIYPAGQDGGEDWAILITSNIQSIVAKFDNKYFVKVCTKQKTIDGSKRQCTVNTIEEAVSKERQIKETIESLWINGER